MIQDQAHPRNLDSKIHLFGFDCFKILIPQLHFGDFFNSIGHTRSSGDVGSMSGLLESGHGWAFVSQCLKRRLACGDKVLLLRRLTDRIFGALHKTCRASNVGGSRPVPWFAALVSHVLAFEIHRASYRWTPAEAGDIRGPFPHFASLMRATVKPATKTAKPAPFAATWRCAPSAPDTAAAKA